MLSIGKEEIEARIEPIIGTLFYERTDVEWDPDQSDAVGVTQALGGTSVRVHLDFEGEATGPNPEVDIDFYLTPVFTTTSVPTVWNFDLQVAGLTASVDFSWWVEVLSGLVSPICTPAISIGSGDAGLYDCISSLEDYIETQVEAGFEVPPPTARLSEARLTAYGARLMRELAVKGVPGCTVWESAGRDTILSSIGTHRPVRDF